MTTARSELPNWEVIDLLASRVVGRLCIIDHGYPIALPVNYRLVTTGDGDRVVVRTAAGTAIERYEGPASLEVDDIDLAGGTAWSLIVRGRLSRVLGDHTLPDPHPLVTEGRHSWMALDIQATSGRRFTVMSSLPGFEVDWQPVEADA